MFNKKINGLLNVWFLTLLSIYLLDFCPLISHTISRTVGYYSGQIFGRCAKNLLWQFRIVYKYESSQNFLFKMRNFIILCFHFIKETDLFLGLVIQNGEQVYSLDSLLQQMVNVMFLKNIVILFSIIFKITL